MNIEQRLSRLERENRLLKRIGAGVVCLAALVAFVAAEEKQEPTRLIESQEFNLVDSSGKRLAVLGKLGKGAGGGGGLMLLDENGKTEVMISRKGVSAFGFRVIDKNGDTVRLIDSN